MSELTYKKIVDVETVEALNDGATVFVNDNGAMKQIGADKFGTVKTVNGFEPDENGEVAFFHSKSFNFADGSLIVPGMINYYGTETMAEVIGWLQSSGTYNVEIKRLVMQTNNDLVNKMCTSYKTYKNDEGGYNAILYFEDDLCPVILNGTNNTITLDPDWVAPEANITESAANTLVDTKVAELATTVDTKLSELAAQELSLPQSAGVVDHGTAGQFAVSDGMGGIMWKTLVEAEGVSY